LVTAFPKAGTHLIKGLLDGLSLRRIGGTIEYYGWPEDDRHQHPLPQVKSWLENLRCRCYLLGHIAWNDEIAQLVEQRRIKVLLMVRDPRDVVVSHVFHCLRLAESKFHDYYHQLPDLSERLRVTITGLDSVSTQLPAYWLPDLSSRFGDFLQWQKSENCLVCRFEDLVGEKGGGTQETQRDAVSRVLDFIGFPEGAKTPETLAGGLFSPVSTTFRKGAIGGWREHFTPEINELFKSTSQELLVKLGYERDDTW
jgi:hypothetical protein